MNDLIFMVHQKMFRQMEWKKRNYDETIKLLCDRMLVIDPMQRIQIHEIVSHPLLMLRVYKTYFNYDKTYGS